MPALSLAPVHPSWRTIVTTALASIDDHYRKFLETNTSWFPGHKQIFNAFSLACSQVNYVLLGESPYPRADSANGFAFWDARVTQLWSERGLSKAVNRATSLRNFIKMLLVAEGYLNCSDTSQAAIAALPKNNLVSSCEELFTNMQARGILLLNASLVLSEQPVRFDAKAWHSFMQHILDALYQARPHSELLLFGKIAEVIKTFPSSQKMRYMTAEHPYNLSFISNPEVLSLFSNMQLLQRFPQL